MINAPGILKNTIFKHSASFGYGMGESSQQKEFVVAQDGSGDFERIEDALIELKKFNGGGKIFIKAGTYEIISMNTGSWLTIDDNTIIEGEGAGTVISIGNVSTQRFLSISGKTNVVLRNFKIYSNVTSSTGWFINGWGATNILIDRVIFDGVSNCAKAYFRTTDDTSDIIFNKCQFIGNCDRFFDTGAGTFSTKIQIINCYLTQQFGVEGDETYLRESTISENIFTNAIILKGMTDSTFINNKTAAGEEVFMESSDRNCCNGNKVYNFDLDANCDNNNICNNRVDVVCADLGTGNTVANNTLY